MKTKQCLKCLQVKELSEFYPNGEKYQSYCKACQREIAREWKRHHPTPKKDNNKSPYKSNVEYKEPPVTKEIWCKDCPIYESMELVSRWQLEKYGDTGEWNFAFCYNTGCYKLGVKNDSNIQGQCRKR